MAFPPAGDDVNFKTKLLLSWSWEFRMNKEDKKIRTVLADKREKDNLDIIYKVASPLVQASSPPQPNRGKSVYAVYYQESSSKMEFRDIKEGQVSTTFPSRLPLLHSERDDRVLVLVLVLALVLVPVLVPVLVLMLVLMLVLALKLVQSMVLVLILLLLLV